MADSGPFSPRFRPEGPAVGRRRLPASERRALILESALRTFATHGYDGAAMDDIAAAAGISKAVVYDHFASKRELYTHLLEAIGDDLERAVEQALALAEAGGEERVRAGLEAFFTYVEQHPEACRLLLLELQSAQVSPVGRQLEERATQELAQTLGSDPGLFGGDSQRTRHLQVLAELLKSAVLGVASWWYRHPDVPRDELVERTVAVAWPAIERAAADGADP